MDFKELLNTKDTTAEYDAGDITANKLYAIIACFPILFWIPLVAAKESRFARFYANQGLTLLIVDLVVALLRYIPFIGGLLSSIAGIITLLLLIFIVVHANNGQAREMPLIGGFIRVFK